MVKLEENYSGTQFIIRIWLSGNPTATNSSNEIIFIGSPVIKWPVKGQWAVGSSRLLVFRSLKPKNGKKSQ